MYEVTLSKDAKKSLNKLNKIDSERIISVLERIRIRPHVFVKKLVGVKYFSARAGKYRIILDIQENKLIIFVIEIGHRKNIYKTL